jgi:uncharacterized protein (DUF305 family)
MNAAVLLAIVAVTGRSATAQQSMPARPQPVSVGDAVLTPAAQAKADSGRPPYTSADVRFMQGMIGHHGQAIVMAGWAPTHDARADVRILAERIAVAQQDEIAMMQRWLRDRRETAPDPGAPHAPDAHDEHAGMDMGGAGIPGMMPGMLTPEQLAQLDRARGPEFDRLFLTFMIQHHQGAVTMVKQLLAVPAAAQDDDVFRFVADVNVDQTTEIDRMRSMLAAPPPPSRP